jgi:hypothetical protein
VIEAIYKFLLPPCVAHTQVIVERYSLFVTINIFQEDKFQILNTSNGNGRASRNIIRRAAITESTFGAGDTIHATAGQELALTATNKSLITDTYALADINKTGAHIEAAQKHGKNNRCYNNDYE